MSDLATRHARAIAYLPSSLAMEAARSSERSPIVTKALLSVDERLAWTSSMTLVTVDSPSFDEVSRHLLAQSARAW